MEVIQPHQEQKVLDIDKNCKNKFKWCWFSHIIKIEGVDYKLGDFYKKINTPGTVCC